MGLLIILAKRKGCRNAYIFGMISPKSNIKKVITMTSMKKRTLGKMSLKIACPAIEKRTIIKILIKLLVIKIVPKRDLGFLSKDLMCLSFLLSLFSFSVCSLRMEKKAISDPDMAADMIKQDKMPTVNSTTL